MPYQPSANVKLGDLYDAKYKELTNSMEQISQILQKYDLQMSNFVKDLGDPRWKNIKDYTGNKTWNQLYNDYVQFQKSLDNLMGAINASKNEANKKIN